jgi:hypothetical protein
LRERARHDDLAIYLCYLAGQPAKSGRIIQARPREDGEDMTQLTDFILAAKLDVPGALGGGA